MVMDIVRGTCNSAGNVYRTGVIPFYIHFPFRRDPDNSQCMLHTVRHERFELYRVLLMAFRRRTIRHPEYDTAVQMLLHYINEIMPMVRYAIAQPLIVDVNEEQLRYYSAIFEDFAPDNMGYVAYFFDMQRHDWHPFPGFTRYHIRPRLHNSDLILNCTHPTTAREIVVMSNGFWTSCNVNIDHATQFLSNAYQIIVRVEHTVQAVITRNTMNWFQELLRACIACTSLFDLTFHNVTTPLDVTLMTQFMTGTGFRAQSPTLFSFTPRSGASEARPSVADVICELRTTVDAHWYLSLRKGLNGSDQIVQQG